MKLLIIFVFGLAITVPATTVHGKRPEPISNGQNARLDQFRYLARIDLEDEKRKITNCGGSLISPNYILTAAHCLENKVKAYVYFGVISRYDGGFFIYVARESFIVHDGYNKTAKENNIALIKIPTVELTKNIQLVKLPKLTENERFANKTVTVTRWSWNCCGSSYFPTGLLQSIRLTVLSNKDCRVQHIFRRYIKKSNLCAKSLVPDTCAGDGGGPVVLENTKKQVAIVSWGHKKGCEAGFPSIFVRITDFLQWIKDNSDVKL